MAQEAAHATSVFIPAPDRVDFAYDQNYGLVYISSGSQILRYRPADGTFLPSWSVDGAVAGIDLYATTRTLAVANRQLTSTGLGRVTFINIDSGSQRDVTFTPANGETGTNSVAFDNTGAAFFSTVNAGFAPSYLRRVKGTAPVENFTGTALYSSAVLTASPSRTSIVWAEVGTNTGGWGVIAPATPTLTRNVIPNAAAPVNLYGIATEDGSARNLIVRNGSAQLRGNTNAVLGGVGSGTQAPADAAYSGSQNLYFLPWQQSNQIFVQSFPAAGGSELVNRLYATNSFGTTSDAFQSGHIRLSQNSSNLMVSVTGGVELFSLSGKYEADPQQVTTPEDTTLTFTPNFTGLPTGAINYAVTANPARGTLSGPLTSNGGSSVTYTPSPNFYGQDSFTVTATTAPGTTAPVTSRVVVYVKVTPVNDAPTAPNYTRSVYSNQTTDFKIPVSDPDEYGYGASMGAASNFPGNYIIHILSQPYQGTVSVVPGSFGTVRYAPAVPAGTNSVTFTYSASDGSLESNIATVTLNLLNQPPVAVSNSYRAPGATTLSVAAPGPLANDIPGQTGAPLSLALVGSAQYGTVTATPNGAFTWSAPSGVPPIYGVFSFRYQAVDSIGSSASTLVFIDTRPLPSAASQSVTLDEDSSKAITLSGTGNGTLTYNVTQLPAHGTLSGTDSARTYTPDANYNGTDSFSFTVYDGRETSAPATVTLNVAPVNDAPTAQNQDFQVDEGIGKSFMLSAADIDGDALTYSITTPPAHGTLFGTAPALTYIPEPGYFGDDSFSYSVSDGSATTAATVTFEIWPVNHAPLASDGTLTVDEDATGDVTLDVTDADGDPLIYEVVTAPAHGTLSGTAPNLHYKAAANYHGPDSFSFRAADEWDTSDTATVSITVNPVNDLPAATNQTIEVDEDTAKPFTLSTSDADGDELTYETVTVPAHGTLEGEGQERVYTPAANFNGTDSFTYTVTDPSGATAQATVTFEVSSANDAPSGSNQTVDLNEDTAKAFVLAGSDSDGDVLTFTIVDTPLHGTLTGSGANRTYTPDANYYGEDTLTYKVSDASASSPVYTVTFNVAAVNDAPVAAPKSVTLAEDTTKAIVLSGSDAEGETLTFAIASNPAHGTLSGTAPNLTYVPDADYNGTDSFTYTVTDASGNVSAPATVSITVTNVNDLPVAHDQTLYLDEDGSLSFTPNGTDADGDTLSYRIIKYPSGTLSGTSPNYTYTPRADFFGTTTLTYVAQDNHGESALATITLVVRPIDDPLTVRPAQKTLPEDSNWGFSVMVYVTDVDNEQLTAEIVQAPAHGTAYVSSAPGVQPSASYLPNHDYFGPDYMEVRVTDEHNNSVIIPVTFEVTPINDPPTVGWFMGNVNEDSTVTDLKPTISDPDNDPVTLTILAQPQHGVATVNPDGVSFTYTPNPNYAGADGFTYAVSDGQVQSAAITCLINVLQVNDAPAATPQFLTTDEDTAKPITLMVADPEGSTLYYTVLTQPAHGTLSGTAPNLIYTPAVNYSGPDAFTFKVSDGSLNDTGTISITVNEVNDAPTANGQSVSATEDTAKAITLGGSDPEGAALTYTISTPPAHGTLTGSGPSRTYTPDANYNGADSFAFTVSDGGLTSAPATVALSIAAVNDAPTANAQAVTTNEDTAKSITLTGSDAEGSALTYTIVANPTKGTLSGTAPNLTYTPNANANGADSFTFKVSDGSLTSSTVTVSITVNAVNDAPVATPQSVTVTAGTAQAITLAGTDVEGNALTYTIVANPTKGVLSGTGANRTYTPNAGATGADSFTFKVNDGQLDSAVVTVNLTINPAAGSPYAVLYTITNQWPGGFTADVKITNVSGANITNGWTLKWNFPGNQQITNLWNGTVTQSGNAVTVKDAGWNKVINTGGNATIGFQASFSGTNAKPTSFTLNGVNCTVQ